MRICTSCKIEKDVDQFSERKESKDGLNRRCKTCITEAKRKWEIENKDKVVASREKRKESLREHRKNGMKIIQNMLKIIKENIVGLKD